MISRKRIELRIEQSTRYPDEMTIRVVDPPLPERSPDKNFRTALAEAGFQVGDRVVLMVRP